VKRVNSGGVVQLGEPLQLRSVVRGGDGWTFSKLTDVKVWRMRDSYASTAAVTAPLNPGDASEVITLVDAKGCRNGEFRVLADSDPLRDPRNDLVHHFTFKAFLFRGQRANEPLIVTAKVQACQERDDCDFVSHQLIEPPPFSLIIILSLFDFQSDCGMTGENDEGRYRRSLLDDLESSPRSPPSNVTSMNWNSQLALRVVGLKDLHPSPSLTDFKLNDPAEPIRVTTSYACGDKMALSAFVASFLTILLSTLIWTLISFCRRGKRIESKFQEAASFIDKMEVGKRQLRRTVSAQAANPDYVRNQLPPPANKPLPPIPHSGVGPRSTNPKSFPVAQLLQELADEGTEYASVQNGDQEEDDGVYVLYYKRSRSAPASLREHIRARPSGAVTDVEDSGAEEDEWQDFGQSPRQTVRSVKKRSQRRQKIRKERAGIPFPSAAGLRANENLGGSRTSIRIGSDESAQVPSACPPSTTSFSVPPLSHSSSNFPATSLASSSPTTTFVTRNEASTQIIIIPETNV